MYSAFLSSHVNKKRLVETAFMQPCGCNRTRRASYPTWGLSLLFFEPTRSHSSSSIGLRWKDKVKKILNEKLSSWGVVTISLRIHSTVLALALINNFLRWTAHQRYFKIPRSIGLTEMSEHFRMSHPYEGRSKYYLEICLSYSPPLISSASLGTISISPKGHHWGLEIAEFWI